VNKLSGFQEIGSFFLAVGFPQQRQLISVSSNTKIKTYSPRFKTLGYKFKMKKKFKL
jgi:hypothetical protein